MEELVQNDPCTQSYGIGGTIYCDDFADVYVGNCNQLSQQEITSQNWPHVVKFNTKVQCCDYVYFVCWSNDLGLNGFIASITGSVTIRSNNTDWDVFPTGLNYDSASPRPPRDLVFAQIKKADCGGLWKKPTLGPKNVSSPAPSPFSFITNPDLLNANFIWYDSGIPSAPLPRPFAGFDHYEFHLYRISAKKLYPHQCIECPCEKCDCDDCGCSCSCSGCDDNANENEKKLAKRAQDKFKTVPGSSNTTPMCNSLPYTPNIPCNPALSVSSLNLCFYLHWGDSASDVFETHDNEVIYITVCNRYSDVEMRGLRITKITIVPSRPLSEIQLVPDCFIHFDCLSPCSCKSREFALTTRNPLPAGPYTIRVEYCVDEIVVTKKLSGNLTSFPITVIQD